METPDAIDSSLLSKEGAELERAIAEELKGQMEMTKEEFEKLLGGQKGEDS